MVNRGFMEVETPMMQVIPGVPLRVRLSLTITRWISICTCYRAGTVPQASGGRWLRACIRINRNFRNEGISVRHNPEFTRWNSIWLTQITKI